MNFNLDHSVNHNIATLAVLLKRQVFRIISKNKLEITPDQWVVLYYLWQKDGSSMGDIASKSKKDFANVTRIVDKLVKQGYVCKRKSKTDSRISNIYLQDKAERIKQGIQDCWEESSAIALKGISEEEQQTLLKILGKIEVNILEHMR